MAQNHECKCGKGVLDVIDIREDVEDHTKSEVILGCDECRHVEYLTIEEAKAEGYLL